MLHSHKDHYICFPLGRPVGNPHQDPRCLPHTARLDTLGSTFSLGTSTFSMMIIPVDEARKENFPSILGAERPRIPFSSRKPRIQLSSHRAHTTNRSATGELVILRTRKLIEGSGCYSLILCHPLPPGALTRSWSH